MTLLEVDDLHVAFYTEDGVVRAVDGLSYRVDRGQTFGVVGESGAGKSVTALSLMRLVEAPGRITGGSIRFGEPDAVDAFESEFPDCVVDLEALRDDPGLTAVARRLDDRGVAGSALTGDPGDDGASIDDLAAADRFDMADVVGKGYAADIGLVDDSDFVIHDGTERYLEVLRAPERAVRRLRGNHVAMIFQDAQTALNPVYTVGEQIAETIRHHLDYDDEAARERAIELLDEVGIPEPEFRYSDYPHEFSGGMQQRAVIAIALSCDPDLLIADEPTTALDVTIEAKILEQIETLSDEFGTAVQLITHDLGIVADRCDRVMVMYAGEPVERAPVEELYYDPKHPYTVGLMSSIPRVGDDRERLQTIPGTMPDLVHVPTGCSFHPRCPYAEDTCRQIDPPLVDPDTGSPPDATSERAAACLEYTGDLEEGLEYEVHVRDDDETGGDRGVDERGGQGG